MIFQIRCEFTPEDQLAGKMKFRDNEYLVLLDCISLKYKVANFGKLAVEKGWPSYPEYIDRWTYHSGLIALVARNKKLHFFSIDTSLESEPETELELKRVDFTTTYDPTSTQGILSVAINKHYVCISIFDDEHSNPCIEVLDRKTSSTQNILDTRGKLATGILLQKNTLIATFDSATCYWDLDKDVKDPFKIEGPVVNRWYPNVHPTLGTKALNQHISTNEIEKGEEAARLWDRADLSWDISSCAELKESLHNAILDLCNKNNIPSTVYYRIDANCQYLVLSPDTNNTRYQHHWGDDELDFDYSEDGPDISREFYIFDILNMSKLNVVTATTPSRLGKFVDFGIAGSLIILMHSQGICRIKMQSSTTILSEIVSENLSSYQFSCESSIKQDTKALTSTSAEVNED